MLLNSDLSWWYFYIDLHGCDNSDAPNGDDLNADAVSLNIWIDSMEPWVQLPGPKSQTGADSEESC